MDNPFSNIQTILPAKQLVEVVFKKAMKSMHHGGDIGITPVTRARRLESKRVEALALLFRERLTKITKDFPNIDSLPQFYSEMVDITVGIDELRKILGSLTGTTRTIWKIHKEHKAQIWNAAPLKARMERKAAFSRCKSVVLQLDQRLEQLEAIRGNLQSLPAFDFSNPRLVVAGFPNVGKSSFIRCVTRATPEVANYPFTTKAVKVGQYSGQGEIKYLKCQVIDTPGLLHGQDEIKNEIEIRALAAIKSLPTMILFLLDPTQIDDLDSQLLLLNGLKKEYPSTAFIVAINKIDLSDPLSLDNLERMVTERCNMRVFGRFSAINSDETHQVMQTIALILFGKKRLITEDERSKVNV